MAERDAVKARKTRAREQQPNAPTRNLESVSEPDDCAGVRLKPAILGDAQVEARISIVCVTRQLGGVEQLHVQFSSLHTCSLKRNVFVVNVRHVCLLRLNLVRLLSLRLLRLPVVGHADDVVNDDL